MSKKTALTIMKLSNLLVSELRDCGDLDFVDCIDEDEVFEIVMGVTDDE